MGMNNYVACNDCKTKLFVGKGLFNISPNSLVDLVAFPEQISDEDKKFYEAQETLHYRLCRFIAVHSGHRISYFNDAYSEYEDGEAWKYQDDLLRPE